MTLTLSRLDSPQLRSALAAGLLAPLLIVCAVYASGALLYFRYSGREPDSADRAPLQRPFELGPALRFAALLVVILFLVEGARRWLGAVGVYLVSLLSGLTDVDAITLSLAHSAQGDVRPEVAIRGIFLAVLSNSLVKAGLIAMIGGRALAARTVPIMVGGLLAGLAALLLI